MRILTDVDEPRVATVWREKTEFSKEVAGGVGLLSDLAGALRMIRRRKGYDAIVLSGNRNATLFAMIYGLMPGRKTPVVMIDCLWYIPSSPLYYLIKKIQFRLMARAVRTFVVWASHEVRDYAAAFSIPEEKFLYVPHHHTLEGYRYEVTSGDFLFSGGDGLRDYETLLKAVRGLDVPVRVATRLPDWNGREPVPPNVDARPASATEFRDWMAAARAVIVPMRSGSLHSGGQQTYLNAMAMGKPVIVADDRGARDYIASGRDGLVVPSGDAGALRSAIRSVVEDPEFARKLAANAKEAADRYSTTACMENILRLVEAVVASEQS